MVWFGGGAVVRWCSLVVGGGEVWWVGGRRVRVGGWGVWTGLTVHPEREGSGEGSQCMLRAQEDHQNCVEWFELDGAHSNSTYIPSLQFSLS
jgi:hypothetical protein